MASRQYRSTVEAKTLSSGINNSVTSMTLNSVTTLPSTYPYTLVIDPDRATEEIVTVTATGGGNVLTIMITARDLQDAQNHIEASSGGYTITNDGEGNTTKSLHGIDTGEGVVVGTLKTQTLTNKTLNLTNNTLTGTKAQFNTAMSDADFATIAGAETLTNKTLTSPIINGGAALTADSTELNHVDGVTSAIQTQLNGKLATTGGTISGNLVTTGYIFPQGNVIYFGDGNDSIVFNEAGNTFTFNADGAKCNLEVRAINATSSLNATDGNFVNVTASNIVSYGDIQAPAANFVRGGGVTITPVANVMTSGNLSFGTTMPSTPFVTVSANSNSVAVENVSYTNNTTTGCTVWLKRTNTTTTFCSAVAVST
jgi:hypothetical protein